MNIAIIKGSKAGGSTIAAILPSIIAAARQNPDLPILGIATERTSAPAMLAAGVPAESIERARSYKSIESKIQRTEGGVVILDTKTRPYEYGLDTFQDKTGARRERAGAKRDPNMHPAAWRTVNRIHYSSTTGAADKYGVDLIEVHRRGHLYVPDRDFGRVEGLGTTARGQAESGIDGDIVLEVEGGIKSRYSTAGARYIVVISDLSFKATREALTLPTIRDGSDPSGRDFRRLRRGLEDLIGPSIEWLAKATDEDRAGWRNLSEPEDPWEEAEFVSDSSEINMEIERYKRLFQVYGLEGQTKEAKDEREDALWRTIGVTSLAAIPDNPRLTPNVLAAGRAIIEDIFLRNRQDRERGEIKELEGKLAKSVEIVERQKSSRKTFKAKPPQAGETE